MEVWKLPHPQKIRFRKRPDFFIESDSKTVSLFYEI
jgi:hypothetical protein